MNYRRWCKRAKNFIQHFAERFREQDKAEAQRDIQHEPLEAHARIAPPLTALGRKRLEAHMRRTLPPPLRAFLEKGSRNCYLHYCWQTPSDLQSLAEETGERTLYGGTALCNAKEMITWQEWCREGPTGHLDDLPPKDKELWSHAVPFAFTGANFLALYDKEDDRDPPVAYLRHDGGSFLLAPNFDEFLRQWEQLCYLGPDWWFLSAFRDPRTGFLDATTPRARAVRKLFGLE